MSDIGGIYALLFGVIAYFLSFWNYNENSNHMVTRLFRLKKNLVVRKKIVERSDSEALEAPITPGENISDLDKLRERSDYMEVRKCCSMDCIRSLIPRQLASFFECFSPNRLE